MERKTVVLVYWKCTRRYESYSSLESFIHRNKQYSRHRIYGGQRNGIYSDHAIELRRVFFLPHPLKTRRGRLPRYKPGPKGARHRG